MDYSSTIKQHKRTIHALNNDIIHVMHNNDDYDDGYASEGYESVIDTYSKNKSVIEDKPIPQWSASKVTDALLYLTKICTKCSQITWQISECCQSN